VGRATGDIHAGNLRGTIAVEAAQAQVVSRSRQAVHLKVPGSTQKVSLETVNGSIRIR
jgi:DUF4097 and DUF4098 domain-containing protein YvlB